MERTFKLRIEEFWKKFQVKEQELYQMIQSQDDPEAIMSRMQELLGVAFDSVYFELSLQEDKCEIILTPEGNRVKWILYYYWMKMAPAELGVRWNFYAAKPPVAEPLPVTFTMYDIEVSDTDFEIFAEENRIGAVIDLFVYAPKFDTCTEQQKYTIFYVLLEHYLGEVNLMEYIGDITFVAKDQETGERVDAVSMLSFLNKHIRKNEWVLIDKPTDCFSTYSMDPVEEDTLDLREDVIAGNSSCVPIINEYYNDDSTTFRFAMENGVMIGFFYYDNTRFTPQTSVAFREEMTEKLLGQIKGRNIADVIGGATGLDYSYLDVIVYDFEEFRLIAKELLENYDFDESGFSEFVRGGDIEL
ncbi:MAG: hypothetical protein ACRC9Q_00380 [Bacteroidales bacterium]